MIKEEKWAKQKPSPLPHALWSGGMEPSPPSDQSGGLPEFIFPSSLYETSIEIEEDFSWAASSLGCVDLNHCTPIRLEGPLITPRSIRCNPLHPHARHFYQSISKANKKYINLRSPQPKHLRPKQPRQETTVLRQNWRQTSYSNKRTSRDAPNFLYESSTKRGGMDSSLNEITDQYSYSNSNYLTLQLSISTIIKRSL